MINGFIRAEAISPDLHVADCRYNTDQIICELKKAADRGAQLVVFPELCITGYTCGDLFFQKSLLDSAIESLFDITESTEDLNLITIVSLPLMVDGKLYNTAAFISRGSVLGIVPKTYLPNYAEYYEKRWFTSAPAEVTDICLCGPSYDIQDVPFGTKILFRCSSVSSFILAAEICEDLWAPLPPSTLHSMAGATVIVNPSAGDETIGKHQYRRDLISGQSGRTLGAYVYASAGHGESTTDMVFAGNNIIAENGSVISEALPFGNGHCSAVIDTERLETERAKNTTFQLTESGYISISFDLDVVETKLERFYSKTPFVPGNQALRDERCELILNIQADGLAKRMEHVHCKKAVVGISGGLDSALALLVAVRAMKQIGRPASDVYAITMPCFGTTKRTRTNAEILCNELGVTFTEINIGESVLKHFEDIEQDPENTDITFENGQARMRTLVLMNKANQLGGLVIGTGDLSELALGWATYNGDHMSMYAVNTGVPKTLVRHIVSYAAENASLSGKNILSECLVNILETPVSPELLPADENGNIAQETENIVGPYELHDFFLYYVLRFGFTPKKIFRIASVTFKDSYDSKTLVYWLRNFYRRFFSQQFKRSCLPDGPKVGSVTLSPRGDWRMPSDAWNSSWMKEVEDIEAALKSE